MTDFRMSLPDTEEDGCSDDDVIAVVKMLKAALTRDKVDLMTAAAAVSQLLSEITAGDPEMRLAAHKVLGLEVRSH